MSGAAGPDRSVRPALPEDASAIARIQARGIAASIEAGLRASADVARGYESAAAQELVVPTLPVDHMRDQWTASLLAPRPEGFGTVVALHSATVAGFATFGPGEELASVPGREDPIGAGVEILAFEVDPDFARAGHGSRMLSAIVDLARPATLRVWVMAGDEARVRFFHNAGFAPAGLRRRLEVSERTVAEHLWWSALEH